MHLLPELVVLSRFEAAKFETYDNNFSWLASKSYQKWKLLFTKNWQFLSGAIVLQLLACFQDLLFQEIAETGPLLHPQLILYE